MKTQQSWGWILAGALAGVILHGAAGWWGTTTFAQATNTTFTTSTTHHTTTQSPPACSPVGSSHTEESLTLTEAIGPTTILIGEDQSQTFFVPAGFTNINANTHTETFVCIPAVPALPPPALIGGGLILGGLGVWRLRRRRGTTGVDGGPA